jgi:hypothetical protein
MEPFTSNYKSHEHSRYVLDLIYQYDSFLDSIETICDMGCGAGLDAFWWATLETRDDPPEPRNYRVFAVDRDTSRLDDEIRSTNNIVIIERDFEEAVAPAKIDLLWSHDSFQYVMNPIRTLSTWNQQMSDNGMLMLSVPEYSGTIHNRITNRSYSHCFFNHNIVGLVHLLAMSGFDCKDAYFYRSQGWIYAAVYKAREPFDHRTTTLYDLAEAGMLNASAETSINTYGYLRQEDLIYPWLDKDFYQYR